MRGHVCPVERGPEEQAQALAVQHGLRPDHGREEHVQRQASPPRRSLDPPERPVAGDRDGRPHAQVGDVARVPVQGQQVAHRVDRRVVRPEQHQHDAPGDDHQRPDDGLPRDALLVHETSEHHVRDELDRAERGQKRLGRERERRKVGQVGDDEDDHRGEPQPVWSEAEVVPRGPGSCAPCLFILSQLVQPGVCQFYDICAQIDAEK